MSFTAAYAPERNPDEPTSALIRRRMDKAVLDSLVQGPLP